MQISTQGLRRVRLASYMLAGLALFGILWLHLLSALLAGLLVYEVVEALTPQLRRWLPGERARLIAVAAISVIVVGLLILLVAGAISLYRHEVGDPDQLWANKLLPLLDKARQQLPLFITEHMPDSVEDMRVMVIGWAQKHSGGLRLAGTTTARAFAHIVIGLVLGAIIALEHGLNHRPTRPLSRELSTRCHRLAQAFHNIIFAQIKISAINTSLAAIFLLVVLPLWGIQVPLAKTLVMITFLTGLLPVVGNLISNTFITIVALSVSLWVGVAALVFLIVVHKLEYFLNARIVGTQIRARTWELLAAMLAFEAAFGLPGLVAAPIYYAWLKSELKAERLI
jgi:predicted PurR-regulated permease PerM